MHEYVHACTLDFFCRDRLGAMSYKDPSTATRDTSLAAVTSHHLALPFNPKLKSSLSSHDLQLAERQETRKSSENLPEYYNLFVPRLQEEDSGYSAAQAMLSNFHTVPESQSSFLRSTSSEQQQERREIMEGINGTDYSSDHCQSHTNQVTTILAEHSDEEDEYDHVIVKPGLAAGGDATANQNKTPAPRYTGDEQLWHMYSEILTSPQPKSREPVAGQHSTSICLRSTRTEGTFATT